MHCKMYSPFSLMLPLGVLVQAFQPYQFDQYDDHYVSALRGRLDSFHERPNDGIIPVDTYASNVH